MNRRSFLKYASKAAVASGVVVAGATLLTEPDPQVVAEDDRAYPEDFKTFSVERTLYAPDDEDMRSNRQEMERELVALRVNPGTIGFDVDVSSPRDGKGLSTYTLRAYGERPMTDMELAS